MGYNGSGTWVRQYNWTNDAANNINIRADRMDGEFNDMCNNGLSLVLTKDGQQAPIANLPMGGFRHTNVGAAVNLTDYARAQEVQNSTYTWGGMVGGTANALTISPNIVVTAYTNGQKFRFKTGSGANTVAATLAVSALAAQPLNKGDGSVALAAGDLAPNTIYEATYDTTNAAFVIGGLVFAGSLSTGPFTATGPGAASNISGSSILTVTGGASPAAGNMIGMKVAKTGTEEFLLGINKNSTTNSVLANSLYMSSYTSTGLFSLGRGDGAGNPGTRDIYNDSTGNMYVGRQFTHQPQATLASATTTDLASVTSNNILVSGTTTINGFGSNAKPGTQFKLQFGGVLTLTYNGTSMIMPTAASIITAANDTADVLCIGVGNYLFTNYTRANGQALVSSGITKSFVAVTGQTPTAATVLTFPHGMGVVPKFIDVWIQNSTAIAGYSVGDLVDISSNTQDGSTNRGIGVYKDATNIYVICGADANFVFGLNKTTGVATAFTYTDWNQLFCSGAA